MRQERVLLFSAENKESAEASVRQLINFLKHMPNISLNADDFCFEIVRHVELYGEDETADVYITANFWT